MQFLCTHVHIVCLPVRGAPGECHYSTLLCCDYFSLSSVVSHAFFALCVYSKFGHHPHPLGDCCAKFCLFCGLHCWASPWRKIAYSITHSLNHPAYLMPQEPKLVPRNNNTNNNNNVSLNISINRLKYCYLGLNVILKTINHRPGDSSWLASSVIASAWADTDMFALCYAVLSVDVACNDCDCMLLYTACPTGIGFIAVGSQMLV